MDVGVFNEMLDGKPNEQTGEKELHITNKRLNWCSLDTVHVNFTILIDVMNPKVINHITYEMFYH